MTGLPEGWRLFEHDAAGYEDWYATARGRRADQAERALLDRLLAPFAGAQNALEVGCGTGHFTRWLAGRIPHVVGLDRAPAMLAEARLRSPRLRLIQADAHALPIRSQTIDLAFFVLTLEFLEDPAVALAEAVRVARRGLIVVALNRWSVGGLSRRWGPDARRLVLGRARDFTLMSLRALASAAAGPRLRVCRWASALFPDGLVAGPARIPLGGVIGLSVELGPVTGAAGDADTRNEREDGQWLQVPRAFTSQRRISRRRRATCIGQWSASWRSWRPWTEEWPRGAAGRSTHRNRRRAQRRSVMRRSERLGPRGRAQGHGAAVRDEGGEPIGQGFLTTNARRIAAGDWAKPGTARADARRSRASGAYRALLQPESYYSYHQAVVEGGYPAARQLKEIMAGVYRCAVLRQRGVVFSSREGDFLVTVGGDLTVGYRIHDREGVQLICAETVAGQTLTAEAVCVLEEARAFGT